MMPLLGLGDWLLVMSTGHQSANFASNSEDTTMIFEIDIPDELVPGVIATAYAEEKAPEDVVAEYAVAMATKTCQDLKVGPYWSGPIQPQFNADGTPFVDPEAPEEPEE
jgi:hypothetical protein